MWRKSFALYTDAAAHFALEDGAHLREVVSVEGITRSGLVPNKAGSVASIAHLSGFGHLGRLAADYKAHFGGRDSVS
jgi:hypothetical protein